MNEIVSAPHQKGQNCQGEAGVFKAITRVAQPSLREPFQDSRTPQMRHDDFVAGWLSATLEKGDIVLLPHFAEKVSDDGYRKRDAPAHVDDVGFRPPRDEREN